MSSELIVVGQPVHKIMKSRYWLWIHVTLILSVLLLLAGSLAFYVAKAKKIDQTINSLSMEVKNAQNTARLTDARLQILQTTTDNQAIKFLEQEKSLQQLTWFTQQRQWRFDEIQYLINLANTTILFAHDITATTRLLEQARRIIHDTQDPMLHNLEEAIQDDQQVLATIKTPDISSIFLQLNEIEQHVDEMPLLGKAFVNEEDNQVHENFTATQTWRDELKRTWQQLKSFIIVRKTQNALRPLIAQEQGEYINQYIHMQLGETQWALLHENKTIYQSSLEQAVLWINRYYVVLNPKTQDVLMRLHELQNEKIEMPTLTLTKSLHALHTLHFKE